MVWHKKAKDGSLAKYLQGTINAIVKNTSKESAIIYAVLLIHVQKD